MNLHSIVGPLVAAVNPTISVTLLRSKGATTNSDFSHTPSYDSYTNIPAQIQAMQFTDLKQMEGLATTGLRRKIYLYGNSNGIVRTLQKGGDLIILPDQSQWLIVFVFETWGHGLKGRQGWCSCCITLQNPTSESAPNITGQGAVWDQSQWNQSQWNP
jgi:hypothetical protein